MVNKKSRKSTQRNRGKRNKTNPQSMRIRGPPGVVVPSEIRTKLTYHLQTSLAPGTSVASLAFTANSPYDPETALGGS